MVFVEQVLGRRGILSASNISVQSLKIPILNKVKAFLSETVHLTLFISSFT